MANTWVASVRTDVRDIELLYRFWTTKGNMNPTSLSHLIRESLSLLTDIIIKQHGLKRSTTEDAVIILTEVLKSHSKGNRKALIEQMQLESLDDRPNNNCQVREDIDEAMEKIQREVEIKDEKSITALRNAILDELEKGKIE